MITSPIDGNRKLQTQTPIGSNSNSSKTQRSMKRKASQLRTNQIAISNTFTVVEVGELREVLFVQLLILFILQAYHKLEPVCLFWQSLRLVEIGIETAVLGSKIFHSI